MIIARQKQLGEACFDDNDDDVSDEIIHILLRMKPRIRLSYTCILL